MLDKKELGNRIRQTRISQKKSQQELGQALNKSHAAISDIELGKTDVSVSDLTKIATFFNIPVSEFLENQQKAVTFSQNRFSKDITPDQLAEAKVSAENFDNYISELAKKKNQ